MRLIPGGTFMMGSAAFYPEERPVREVRVDPFWIDETPVTNAQFAEFVAATGYVTFAEIAPNASDYPGMDPTLALPGSLVFVGSDQPYRLSLRHVVGSIRQALSAVSSWNGLILPHHCLCVLRRSHAPKLIWLGSVTGWHR